MKFYAKNKTPEEGRKLAELAYGLAGTTCPLAITFTNREYAKLEYYGKWEDFKKLLNAHNIERHKFVEVKNASKENN